MARRADISVILLFNRKAFRADFAKPINASSTPTLFVQESIDAEASLCDAVRAVVENQSRLATRTLVLSTDVWSQIISLPRISIGGMETSELEAALRFEAETLSGIEIDNLSLAYRAVGNVGDFDQFWVNVVRQVELESVNAFLEKQGCREITLAHPAGFANSGTERLDGMSAELWDDLIYLLSQNGTQLAKVKQASGEPELECDRLLIASGREVAIESRPQQTVELIDDVSIVGWAAGVASSYAQRRERQIAPVLRKSRLRNGTPVRHVVSGMLAIAMLGFCYWHWQYMEINNRKLAQEIVEVKKPAADKKGFDNQIVGILQSRTELETESDLLDNDLNRIRFFLDNQHDRVGILLRLLIELRTQDLVIQQIDGTKDGLEISGFSLNGESAQALAKRLRIEAQPLGWRANPAKQKGQEKLTTGGPWDFRILLTDVGPASSVETERAAELRVLRY